MNQIKPVPFGGIKSFGNFCISARGYPGGPPPPL